MSHLKKQVPLKPKQIDWFIWLQMNFTERQESSVIRWEANIFDLGFVWEIESLISEPNNVVRVGVSGSPEEMST